MLEVSTLASRVRKFHGRGARPEVVANARDARWIQAHWNELGPCDLALAAEVADAPLRGALLDRLRAVAP